jgi:predicted nucleic acid-binding protein
MKVLFDTSVLVAAIIQDHPMHARALPWLKRARAKEFSFLVSTHSLAELYSVLSTLPLKPRISPGTAWRLVHENVETIAKSISLDSADYAWIIKQLSDQGLSGGVVYDALIARTAQNARATHLLTLNAHDFKRLWPEIQSLITTP